MPDAQSLKEKLDAEPERAEAWRPTDGQELIGTVVALNERTTEQGTYPIVTVKPDGEEPALAFHAFHKVAKDQLAEQRPRVGDGIGIRYLGEVDGASFKYHNYRVALDHPPRGGVDWDRQAKSPEDIAADEALAASQEALLKERDAMDEDIPF
jgi:hypothetical protein